MLFLVGWDAHLLNNSSARAAIQTLRKIFKYVGLPCTLVSDNGTNFVSEEFEKFLHGNFIKHVRTPPGHHQSNGLVERKMQELKFWLNKQDCAYDIDYQLTAFCLHTNSTPAANGSIPADFVFIKSIRTRLFALLTERDLPATSQHAYIANQPSVIVAKHGSNTFVDHKNRLVHEADITAEPASMPTSTSNIRKETPAISATPQLRRSTRNRHPPDRYVPLRLVEGCCELACSDLMQ